MPAPTTITRIISPPFRTSPGERAIALRGSRQGPTLVRGLDRGGQLITRRDSELAIDAAEMHFDRLDREVQRGGDLAVGQSARGRARDAQLGRCECIAVVEVGAAQSETGGLQFVVGALGERSRAAPLREPQPDVELLASGSTLVRASQRRSELDMRASALERRRAAIERRDGVAQQGQTAFAAVDDAGGAEGVGDRDRRA
jgi:hypothetical protein